MILDPPPCLRSMILLKLQAPKMARKQRCVRMLWATLWLQRLSRGRIHYSVGGMILFVVIVHRSQCLVTRLLDSLFMVEFLTVSDGSPNVTFVPSGEVYIILTHYIIYISKYI